MPANPTNGTTTAFSNTPQALNDSYSFTEDSLLSLDSFIAQINVVSLNVTANDHGGNAISLYSLDDGLNNLVDLLQRDAVTNGLSNWEYVISAVGSGDSIRIRNGRVDLDLSASISALTGDLTNINSLASNDVIHDTFDYAIQLGSGALSWATVTVNVIGSNDAATITGTDTGSVKEDTAGQTSTGGILTVHDVDHGESRFRTPASLAGSYGTFTFGAMTGVWSYMLDHDLANGLSGGQIVHDKLTVVSFDGTASDTIDVTVVGTDEALVLPDGGATASFTFGSAGNGFNTVIGGNGFDTLAVTYTGTQFVQITSDGQIINGHILIDFDHDGQTDLTVSGVEELVVNAQHVVVTGDLSHTGLADQTITFNGTIGNDSFDASGMTSTENVIANGYEGDDILIGAGGNDTFVGGDGNDTLIGGDGRDTAVYTDATGGITVNLAAGTASGPGVGTDTLRSIENIRGSNSIDHIVAAGFGGSSTNAGSFDTRNLIEGMGGDDVITGNGNTAVSYQSATGSVHVDLLTGTADGDASVGHDTFTGGVNGVIGSASDDTLLGSNGTDFFFGGPGNDFIDGRGGFDLAIYSSIPVNADTTITGGVNINLALGNVTGNGVGTDTLRSIEQVRGTKFDDVFDATGFNTTSANAASTGTNNFNSFEGMGGNDTITGNGSTSIQFLLATGGVTVNLALGTAIGDASVGADTIIGGVINVTGSSFDDTLTGNSNNNNLIGGTGADTINGGDGNDTIFPVTSTTMDDAADVIDGGPGFDTVNYSAYTTNLSVTLNGSTPVTVFGSGSTDATCDTIVNIENFTAGSGNDILIGDNISNTLVGGPGADTISGGDFGDFIVGGPGADVMDGGPGPDTYAFGTGDVVAGEIINDTGSAFTDTIVLNSSVDFSPATISGIEALSFIGSANLAGPAVFPQTATFDASQLPASLSITGTTGIQNIIVNNAMAWSGAAWTFSNWTAGTDTVTINGTGGDDWITGSIQADKIAGGAGDDTLTGGAGADMFAVTPGFGQDTITDFDPSRDVINFDPALFANYMAVMDATAQVGSDAVITYDSNSSVTLTNVDASSLSQNNFQFS